MALGLTLALAPPYGSAAEQAAAHIVYAAVVDSIIHPASAEYIAATLDRADLAWSSDGRYLLYETNGRQGADIFVLPLATTRSPEPFLRTSASETQARFSPDARWVAYASNESGSHEVYVRRFPDTGAKWQISTRGGAQPQWRRDGKELFYLGLDGKLMAAAISDGSVAIEAADPRELFDTGIVASVLDRRNQYAVTKDGQRFLVNLSAEDEARRRLPW